MREYDIYVIKKPMKRSSAGVPVMLDGESSYAADVCVKNEKLSAIADTPKFLAILLREAAFFTSRMVSGNSVTLYLMKPIAMASHQGKGTLISSFVSGTVQCRTTFLWEDLNQVKRRRGGHLRAEVPPLS